MLVQIIEAVFYPLAKLDTWDNNKNLPSTLNALSPLVKLDEGDNQGKSPLEPQEHREITYITFVSCISNQQRIICMAVNFPSSTRNWPPSTS